MNKNIFYLLTTLIFIGCGNKLPDLSSPDSLGKAYIKFINDGAKYEDYLALITTPDEAYKVALEVEGGRIERAEEYRARLLQCFDYLKKDWENLSKYFTSVLNLKPFNYNSIQTEEIETESWYEDNFIIATTKDGLQKRFILRYICKIDNNWKIIPFGFSPGEPIIEMH